VLQKYNTQTVVVTLSATHRCHPERSEGSLFSFVRLRFFVAAASQNDKRMGLFQNDKEWYALE